MNIIKFFLCLLLLSLVLLGCEAKKYSSVGQNDEIIVICDTEECKLFQPELKTTFEREIGTPGIEKFLTLSYANIDQINSFNRRKNLILISTLSSTGETIQKIKEILGETNVQRVQAGENFFYQIKNPWAFGQILLVFAANTPDELKKRIIENKNTLFNIFDDRLNQIALAELYVKGEQHNLAKEILTKYGCSLRIQHEYRIFYESEEEGCFILFRDIPKRWITVGWFETDDPSLLTQEWCYQFRNNLFAKFDGTEEIDTRYTTVEEVDFQGKYALKLIGLYGGKLEDGWPKVYGGPFRSYFFYEPADRRIYMVDYSVFAPDREKKNILRQLDIMVHTFYTENDLKKKGK
ncbi:DUF4837 family protein [candidate division KSB1 bacterium]|nr:DUF4837 family protein [candidate division KSB1 bacterium]